MTLTVAQATISPFGHIAQMGPGRLYVEIKKQSTVTGRCSCYNTLSALSPCNTSENVFHRLASYSTSIHHGAAGTSLDDRARYRRKHTT